MMGVAGGKKIYQASYIIYIERKELRDGPIYYLCTREAPVVTAPEACYMARRRDHVEEMLRLLFSNYLDHLMKKIKAGEIPAFIEEEEVVDDEDD